MNGGNNLTAPASRYGAAFLLRNVWSAAESNPLLWLKPPVPCCR